MRIDRALLVGVIGLFACSLAVAVAEARSPKVIVARARIKIKVGGHKAAKRSKLFQQLHGVSGQDQAGVSGPRAPDSSAPVEQSKQQIELYGPISEGLDMDVEFVYASSNRSEDVWVEGRGWVSEPKLKEVRPDIEPTGDGTYRVVIPTFNKGWFGAKYYLKSAKFTIHKGDAKPSSFEVRGDTGGNALGIEQTLKVLVMTKREGRRGEQLSVDVQTYAGSAPNNILQIPRGDGHFWLEIPIELQG